MSLPKSLIGISFYNFPLEWKTLPLIGNCELYLFFIFYLDGTEKMNKFLFVGACCQNDRFPYVENFIFGEKGDRTTRYEYETPCPGCSVAPGE